jgi:hypothetical protein
MSKNRRPFAATDSLYQISQTPEHEPLRERSGEIRAPPRSQIDFNDVKEPRCEATREN